MPPRSSRRSAVTRGKPAPAPADPPPQEVDVELPEDATDASAVMEDAAPAEPALEEGAEPSATSSKRARAGASQRRGASKRESAKKPAAPKRELTTEEIEANRQKVRFAIKLTIGLILVFAAGFAFWWFAIRKDENLNKALEELSASGADLGLMETMIKNHQPSEAKRIYEQAHKRLSESPRLGFASDKPSPDQPGLVSLEKAAEAYGLLQKVEAMKPKIEKLDRDDKMAVQYKDVVGKFGQLADLSDEELAKLEKHANDFLENPVEPGSGRNDGYIADYPSEVNQVKVSMQKIATEKARRLDARVKQPVDACMREVEELVKREAFQDALGKVDEYGRKYTEANFAEVRKYVDESSDKAWASVEAYVKTHYADYSAPGSTEAGRKQALKDAQDRLKQVIATFGVERHVNAAKELLAKYPEVQ